MECDRDWKGRNQQDVECGVRNSFNLGRSFQTHEFSKGVHIRQPAESRVNPTPIFLEESDLLMERYLSLSKLQLLTGVDDLSLVEFLELRVDSRETSLGNFGSLLPNLVELKLNGSHVACVRDLGSSLRSLRVLWMPHCGLEELDGISALSELRDLYVQYNEISDLSPLSMLENLEILDLEGNNVLDISQIQYLSLCPVLQKLSLEGNPVCLSPSSEHGQTEEGFRDAIRKILPNLLILNDEFLQAVSSPSESVPARFSVFDEDWSYLEELQKEALLREEFLNSQDMQDVSERPPSAALRAATAYRPGSALKPSSACYSSSTPRRPATTASSSNSSLATGSHSPNTRWPMSSDTADSYEVTSELTTGGVICGNPSKALLQRKQGKFDYKEDIHLKLNRLLEKSGVSDLSEARAPSIEAEGSKIIEELRAWKQDHDKRMKEMLKSKEAQILVVDHKDYEESDVSDESDDSDNNDKDVDNEKSAEESKDGPLADSTETSQSRLTRICQKHPEDQQTQAISLHRSLERGASNYTDSRDREENSAAYFYSRTSHSNNAAPAESSEYGFCDQSFDVEDNSTGSEEAHGLASSSSSSCSLLAWSPSMGDGLCRETITHYKQLSGIHSDISLSPLAVLSPRSLPVLHKGSKAGHEPSVLLQKKLRIGSTGLPLSAQMQQPIIRNSLTPSPAFSRRPPLGSPTNVVPLPSQPRIQRHLPESKSLIPQSTGNS